MEMCNAKGFGGERKAPEIATLQTAMEKCIAKGFGGERKAPKVRKRKQVCFF